MKLLQRVALIAVAVLLILIAVKLLSSEKTRIPPPTIASVVVTKVVEQPTPVLLEASGSIEALAAANVTPQITGIIKKVYFNSGEHVLKDQLLFEIDPAPFESSLRQAKANLARDQATLVSDQKDLVRYGTLLKSGYVSQQQYDQTTAQVKVDQATVSADKQLVKQAEIELTYTKILAPIAGKTGNVFVKEGDLVTAASATPLFTINKLDSVLVDFNLPQNQLIRLRTYHHEAPLNVQVMSEDGNMTLGEGTVNFIDNNISATTGTVLVKASVNNPKELLWPGLLVRVKLVLTTEPHAMVVPTQSINIDQQGNFVYVVQAGKAVVKHITVDRQVGNLTVISKGLSLGEEVVVVSPPNLNDGDKVVIRPNLKGNE